MKRDLSITGQIHRTSRRSEDLKKRLTRHYSRIDNAISGLTRFMLQHGYVGDVCEVYHNGSGRQLGTIKMTAKGNLKTSWIWD